MSMIEFDNYPFVKGGVCAAKGFVAGGVNAGIKAGSTKKDLAVISCEKKCAAAAVYTQNKVKGAPITVTKKNIKDYTAQAVIVNSGNANTCNPDGIEIAQKMCDLCAEKLKIDSKDVIVASTGVIGQPLSIEPIKNKIDDLVAALSDNGSSDACDAIMTTDTRRKELAVRFTIDGKTCHIGGISKGSGMIHPNMATMLCFLTTDVNIGGELLQKALSRITKITYNMVSVDGDTSTNDMACIMASGLAENKKIIAEDGDYEIFANALYAVMMNLARETARDGEGATRLMEVAVTGAPTSDVAKSVAMSVAKSSLLKAAIFAADANWGRVLCAIGYAKGNFDISKTEVVFSSKEGSVKVCDKGAGVPFSEDKAYKVLNTDEVKILINLHDGTDSAVAWGCDLTYDYVKINAEYRS